MQILIKNIAILLIAIFITNISTFADENDFLAQKSLMKDRKIGISKRTFLKKSGAFAALLALFTTIPSLVFANSRESKKSTTQALSIESIIQYTEIALKKYIVSFKNNLGLPVSFHNVENYPYKVNYPDRAYIFDIGSLFVYTSQKQNKFKAEISPVIKSVLKLRRNHLWNRSYGNFGPTENIHIGPCAVLYRGLLAWGYKQEAMDFADFLIDNDNCQIFVNGYYVIKQNPLNNASEGSPEENARIAIFLLDLHDQLISEGKTEKAQKYLLAAENIFLGLSSIRGEIYPFGIRTNGTANWSMPDREGVEGQAVVLQAINQYIQTDNLLKSKQYKDLIENDFARKQEVLNWIERTHLHSDIVFSNIDHKKSKIKLAFAKRILNGKASPHIWVEFTARMALSYKTIFFDMKKYNKLIDGLLQLQLDSGLFPYAITFNGFNQPPVWSLGSDTRTLNHPFASLVATIDFLFSIQSDADEAIKWFASQDNEISKREIFLGSIAASKKIVQSA